MDLGIPLAHIARILVQRFADGPRGAHRLLHVMVKVLVELALPRATPCEPHCCTSRVVHRAHLVHLVFCRLGLGCEILILLLLSQCVLAVLHSRLHPALRRLRGRGVRCRRGRFLQLRQNLVDQRLLHRLLQRLALSDQLEAARLDTLVLDRVYRVILQLWVDFGEAFDLLVDSLALRLCRSGGLDCREVASLAWHRTLAHFDRVEVIPEVVP
mmetsp:Transcript_7771/g.19165  ORF Transcript_7771/g.19165 Transcript_7771/m.19165 type:complete len:213 (-) Transcript_7771:1459-2097(-)